MKICKYCNTENNEEFIFCSTCGKRIDGNKICPHCKQTIKENAKFCGFCGIRVDRKKECSNCHKEIESNLDFCPFCGNKAKTNTKNNKNTTFNLITKIILLSLSCLFIIGLFLPFLSMELQSTQAKTHSYLYIYNFFSKNFFESFYTESNVNGTGLTSEYVIAHNTRLTINMIITYLGIISTLITSIISIIKNAISISNNEKLPSYKIAISSGLCYFALTFGLSQSIIGLTSFTIPTTSIQNTITISLSAMPIILLIISILSIITIAIFNIIQNKITIKKYISIGLRLLSFSLSLVTTFLICGNVLTYNLIDITYCSFLSVISLTNENIFWVLILFIIATLITLYTVYGTFIKIYKITEKSFISTLINSIINSTLIIILFILTIIISYNVKSTLSTSLGSGIIISLIFALISLGLDISSFIITRKENY